MPSTLNGHILISSLNTWLLFTDKWHLSENKCHLLKFSPPAPRQGSPSSEKIRDTSAGVNERVLTKNI